MSAVVAKASPESLGPDAAETACLILDKLGWKHRDGQWESPRTSPATFTAPIQHFEFGFNLGHQFGQEDRRRMLDELRQCWAELETAAELIAHSLPATATIFTQAAERVEAFMSAHQK